MLWVRQILLKIMWSVSFRLFLQSQCLGFLRLTTLHSQDYRLEKKWSAVGFCSGAIAGLVAITPGSGFVGAREYTFSSQGIILIAFCDFDIG